MSDTVSGPLTAESIAGAAYIVAALLFILSLAGLSKHEKARSGVIYGITGMVIALAATIWLTLQGAWGTGHGLTGLALLAGRGPGRRSHRALACPRRGNDRHAGADCAAAQLRRPRRGAGGLERAPRSPGPVR